MANLGKLITAAGAAIVVVFSLVGMIVTLAGRTVYGTHYGPDAGDVVNGIFEFLILVAVSGALVAGALSFCKYCATLLAPLAIGVIVLVLAAGLPLSFYAAFGGVVALIGSCWRNPCCASVNAGAEGTVPTTETPPESKL